MSKLITITDYLTLSFQALEDLYCAYDSTVRNSVGEVIQFVYGSDGLDPMTMEAKYKKSKDSKPTKVDGTRPLDFARILEQICVSWKILSVEY